MNSKTTSPEAPIEGKSYTVIISDYQRKLIESALKSVLVDLKIAAILVDGPGEVHDNAFEEAVALADMLAELPEVEKASPGTIHGLCL